MAWTAGVGRSHFTYRAGVVFRDAASLREGLRAVVEASEPSEPREAEKATFIYNGLHGDCAGMAKALYGSEPTARDVLERCDAVFRELTGAPLLNATSAGEAEQGGLDSAARQRATLYAVQCALTALWDGVGVRPGAIAARSGGEPAAAQAAGLLSLEDGMRLAATEDALPAEVAAALRDSAAGEQGYALVIEIGADSKFVESGCRGLCGRAGNFLRRAVRRGVAAPGLAARLSLPSPPLLGPRSGLNLGLGIPRKGSVCL